ncbi:MAG: hypothetical protein J6B74_08775 [Ruminococcus sp.]|nr:hypothetical protein [Ruminococcus sp.]
MDKREKMNQIKEYISRIEEDLNTSVRSDRETITNKNILQCMKYISELLEETINESSSKTSQSGKRFFITAEQHEQLTIMKNVIVSTMVSEINRVTQCNNTEKIIESWITEWLMEKGFLELNSYYATVPSKAGRQLGITANSYDTFPRKYYTKKAQQFIYDNIDSIIAFHYGEN